MGPRFEGAWVGAKSGGMVSVLLNLGLGTPVAPPVVKKFLVKVYLKSSSLG